MAVWSVNFGGSVSCAVDLFYMQQVRGCGKTEGRRHVLGQSLGSFSSVRRGTSELGKERS